MNDHLPIILVVAPLLSAFLATVFGLWLGPHAARFFALLGLVVVVVAAVSCAGEVLAGRTLHYHLSGWPPPIGIELVVDHLSALLVAVIAVVALMSVLHSMALVERELGSAAVQFYTLASLLVTALMGITLTGDAFNLFVMLEISSLSTYGLVALGGGRAYFSTFNYVIMGTIGASFYLLGVGYLYIKTGTLNMADLQAHLPGLYGSETVLVGFSLMLIGTLIKMALFPLHAWLPNAYTYAPSAVTSLIAPLSTKVSVYIMLRILFSVFTPTYAFGVLDWSKILVPLAALGIVGGSMLALAQRDFKKMLTCIIVAEAGYMVGGVWLGNVEGVVGATFHILNDALVTLCLFMIVGNIVYRRGGHSFNELPHLFSRMPWTMGALVVSAMAVIGIPPTSGFFSKFYLISGAIEGGYLVFAVALLLASLCNVGLFFRVMERAYFSPDHHHVEPDEAPPSMVVPAVATAAGLIVLGLFSAPIVEHFILPTVRV